MYAPNSPCSALIHTLVKYPILVIAIGLAAAGLFLTENKDIPALQEKIASVSTPKIEAKADKVEPLFAAIMKAESNLDKDMVELTEKYFDAMTQLGGNHFGVHPDGKSYGAPGLTTQAIDDITRKLPTCASFGYNDILDNDLATEQFAYLYFLDLVHKYKSIDTAVNAYHYGPTRIHRWRAEGKHIPTEYLNKVKSLVKK